MTQIIIPEEKKRIIRKLKESLGWPLHWRMCLQHFNELPFRKHFAIMDSETTTGPLSSSGVTLVLDNNPKDLPIDNFLPFSEKVRDIDENISKDLN